MAKRKTSKAETNPYSRLWFDSESNMDAAYKVLAAKKMFSKKHGPDESRRSSGRPAYHLTYSGPESPGYVERVLMQNPRYTVYDEHGKPVLKTWRGKTAKSAARVIEGSVKRFGKKIFSGKRNPAGAAAELYEEFHGKPSDRVIEVAEEVHEHLNLTELGDLVSLKVETVSGYDAEIKFDYEAGEFPVKLSSSEDGRQLYFVGGNQELDLSALGMDGEDWLKDSMVIGTLYMVTYRTEKDFENFEEVDFFHALGEETGVEPTLIYDYMNSNMSVAGGQYRVERPGIIN